MHMVDIFPHSAGVSHVRGIVRIISQNEGAVSISELAEEAEEDVDDLLPLIDACELMGLASVKDSEIRITEKGAKMVKSGPFKILRESIKKVEPFRSTIAAIAKNKKTTEEIAEYLMGKGIVVDQIPENNVQTLRKLLRNWGAGTRLLSYDEQNDSWSIRSY